MFHTFVIFNAVDAEQPFRLPPTMHPYNDPRQPPWQPDGIIRDPDPCTFCLVFSVYTFTVHPAPPLFPNIFPNLQPQPQFPDPDNPLMMPPRGGRGGPRFDPRPPEFDPMLPPSRRGGRGGGFGGGHPDMFGG